MNPGTARVWRWRWLQLVKFQAVTSIWTLLLLLGGSVPRWALAVPIISAGIGLYALYQVHTCDTLLAAWDRTLNRKSH